MDEEERRVWSGDGGAGEVIVTPPCKSPFSPSNRTRMALWPPLASPTHLPVLFGCDRWSSGSGAQTARRRGQRSDVTSALPVPTGRYNLGDAPNFPLLKKNSNFVTLLRCFFLDPIVLATTVMALL